MILLRVAWTIERLYCTDCRRIIWPWQSRCGHAHTTCRHAQILRLWRQNLVATTGPASPWSCTDCGLVPA